MNQYLTKQKAEKIWQKGLDNARSLWTEQACKEYIFHTKGIAACCQKIAVLTTDLDSDRTYISGLLHDYGKCFLKNQKYFFHGQIGYEKLTELGYPQIARICLTHTFYAPDFDFSHFTSYPYDGLVWAKKQMQGMIFDDYDKIVQLCDMFFEGTAVVSIEKRFAGIQKRYDLNWNVLENSYHNAIKLKEYFSRKCGTDVYELLEIK